MITSPGPKPAAVDLHSAQHVAIFQRLFEGLGLLRAGAGISISWDGSHYIIAATAKAAPPATSSVGMVYRGIWSAGTYVSNDVVVVQSGVSAGTYISVIDANTNDPATGVGWIQLAPGNTVGNWS